MEWIRNYFIKNEKEQKEVHIGVGRKGKNNVIILSLQILKLLYIKHVGAYCKPHSTCFFIIAMVIIRCNLASSTLSKAHCLFLTATLLELMDSAVLVSGSMETQRTVFIPCFSFYPSRLFLMKRRSECIQLN